MISGQSNKASKVIVASLLLILAIVLSQTVVAYFMPPKAVLHLGDGRFDIRIADTDRTRKKGLSDTPSLPADEALLFVFDRNGRWSIWMKDMNYPIDIVWLDDSMKVVDYVMNVPPDSYPTKSFFPKEDARYVVEFSSGTIKKKGIRLGQKAIVSGTSRQL